MSGRTQFGGKAFSVAVLAVVGIAALGPAALSQEVVTATGRGWLEWVDQGGQSLAVLHTSGSHYDMGYQHGYLLKDQVVENMQAGLNFVYTNPHVLHAPSEIPDAVDILESNTPQKYLDEVQGIIDGVAAAGGPQLEYDDVLTVQMMADLTQVMCTQFAARGSATKDGHVIHGRNLDWPTVPGLAHDNSVIHVAKGTGEQPICNTSWAGYVGTVTGMNGKGISVGTNNCPSSDSNFHGMPLTFLLRNALETSSTMDEYVDAIAGNPRTCGTNLVVGSGREAGGARVAAIEVTPTRCDVYTDNDPAEAHYWDPDTQTSHATKDEMDWLTVSEGIQDAVVRTNHFLDWDGDPPLQALQAGATILRFLDPNMVIAMGFDPNSLMDVDWVMDNVYPEQIVPLILGEAPYNMLLPEVEEPNWTRLRYNRMQGLITDPNHFGEIDGLMGIEFMTDPNGIADELSMHSVVFDATSLEVWVANARTDYSTDPNGIVLDATSEPYVYFNFGAAIPEPATLVVWLTGGVLAARSRYRRRGCTVARRRGRDLCTA